MIGILPEITIERLIIGKGLTLGLPAWCQETFKILEFFNAGSSVERPIKINNEARRWGVFDGAGTMMKDKKLLR